jgi:uncharacterized protein YecE (DUF72 family)
MKFGKVAENEVDAVNFSLPPEPAGNKKILGGIAKPHTIHIGCPQWIVPGWLGKVYPAKAKDKDMLANYVRNFNCIELNATHYKIYDQEGIGKWAEKATGRDFLFCPKMFQGITHQGSLKGKEALMNDFFQGLKAFQQHLGPVFIQLSDSFGPNRKQELFEFLKSLPKDLTFFLEVRHPDWFAQETAKRELFNTLYLLKTGSVITDVAGRRDCAHMHLTIPKAFVRFVANSKHPTDYMRLDNWVERIKGWLENGLEELYFFIHMPDELYSPELTVYLTDKLKTACGLDLPRPIFIQPEGQAEGTQVSLF